MDPAAREAARQANREKNERRRANKQKFSTTYARQGNQLRKEFKGAFGKAPAKMYNACVEGTTAPRRAEHDLEAEE